MTRKKGMMSRQLFAKVVDEIADHDTKMVTLHHSGESFLHKGLFDCIRYAKGKGLTMAITTNGTLLDKDDFEILGTGIDVINVSFAGMNDEDYLSVRTRSGFAEVKNNVTKLADKKRELGARTKIKINVVATRNNIHKKDGFIKTFENIEGIDSVFIRELMDWHGNVDVDDMKYKRDMGIMDHLWGLKQRLKPPCPAVYTSVGILWNGDVVPCCFDYNGDLVMGNINNESIYAVWNSELYNDFRKSISTRRKIRKNEICARCRG